MHKTQKFICEQGSLPVMIFPFQKCYHSTHPFPPHQPPPLQKRQNYQTPLCIVGMGTKHNPRFLRTPQSPSKYPAGKTILMPLLLLSLPLYACKYCIANINIQNALAHQPYQYTRNLNIPYFLGVFLLLLSFHYNNNNKIICKP